LDVSKTIRKEQKMMREFRNPTAVLADSNDKTGFHQKSTFTVKTSLGSSLLYEIDCDGSNTLQRVAGRNITVFDFP